MLKLSAPASSTSSAAGSAGSKVKLGSGGVGNSSSSTGMMPPPPSDLLSRLDAFLPQLAKANQDLLSKKTPTHGKDMEVEGSNGDAGNGDDGAEGMAAAASFCASASASAAAAVASLQIDADMVQCGDSGDSDSDSDSSSDDSDSDSDDEDDDTEKAPPTIEMSIALGPFGGGGMSDDGGALVNIGSGNMEDIAEDSDSKHCPKPEQQPKKRKVLIEEISS